MIDNMAAPQNYMNDLAEDLGDKVTVSSTLQRPNALSNRISSVLSASYADLEIRDALRTLDERQIKNTAETRRRIRLDVQKEVMEHNGDIIKDFGLVAEVRSSVHVLECWR